MLEFGRKGLLVGVVCLMGLLTVVPAESAYTIDLEWRPLDQTVNVLDAVDIGLYGVYVPDPNDPDPPAVGEMSSAQTIMTWDTDYLQLTGNYDGLWSSGFMAGNSFGFNEATPAGRRRWHVDRHGVSWPDDGYCAGRNPSDDDHVSGIGGDSGNACDDLAELTVARASRGLHEGHVGHV